MAKRPEPESKEVTVSIRFPEDLHLEAKAAASADDRSLNSLVVRAVRTYLEKERKGGK